MNPRDNPKEHKRMSSDTDETQSESMSEPETSGELETMNVRLKDENLYQVGNPNEGTAYLVDMHNADHDGTMTCSCPDYRFRAQEGEHRACKHIQRVIQVSPSEVTTDQLAFRQLVREYEILSDKVDSVMQDLTRAQSNGAGHSQPSQSDSVPASDAAGDGKQMAEVSVEEAAEKLQSAYDERVTGMNVKAMNGKVWINKSPDAPDYTFAAFLRDPDQTRYDPDNAPEQYYQNYIEPGDVDQYISEVLE